MPLEIRAITDAEAEAYREAMMTTFGDDQDSDPEGPTRVRALVPQGQAWAAFDGANIVGTGATFDLKIGVPGGAELPMAGLTMVMVRPTHRRRGILRELIRLHLADARRRGYGLSGLWASEAAIYQRFGYGVAAEGDSVEIKNAYAVELAPRELDDVQWITADQARADLPGIYARSLAGRPGALVRSPVWWQYRRFLESPFMRDGASKRRHVVAMRGSDAVGYVQFRQRPSFVDGLPAGKVEILELVGIDARAETTLWQFVLRVDLFPTVTWWNAPTDLALPWMVNDPRRIRRTRADTLWLRVEGIAAVLGSRTYGGDGAIRFALDDDTGETWELAVERGHVRCTTLARDPELRFARHTLGSLFLGGVPASQLARAGLVRSTSEAALETADRLFASPRVPWCPEVF